MKKISLLLIFCFLFQGCVSGTLFFIGRNIDKQKGRKLKRNKDCTFQEFILDREETNAPKFAFWGIPIDFGIAIHYFLRVNPVGLHLIANASYIYYALLVYSGSSDSGKYKDYGMIKKGIDLQTWENDFVNECKEEYFVFPYEHEELLKQGETDFLKAILQYPDNYDITQDQNFSDFKKNFLRNTKMQIYYQVNIHYPYYRYIHYPGGKAKFEEDFGKYLFKP